MPLSQECSKEAVSANIRQWMEEKADEAKKAGRSRKELQQQAIAVALSTLKKACGVSSEARMTPSEIVAAGRQEEEAFGLAGPPKIFSSVRVKPTTKQPGKPVHRKARSGKEQPFIDPEDFSVRVSTRSGRGARASVKEGGMGRFSELMRAIQEDKNKDRDGAVHRTEFDVNILYKDLGADRERIEGFVLAKTHKAHRYMLAKGGQGIVYHDQRGRAVSCAINDIPDGELYWLARQKGWNSNRESTSLE